MPKPSQQELALKVAEAHQKLGQSELDLERLARENAERYRRAVVQVNQTRDADIERTLRG